MICTLNVSEEILNKFKNFEVHAYYDNFSLPTAIIVEDNNMVLVNDADYDRISFGIIQLRRRKKDS